MNAPARPRLKSITAASDGPPHAPQPVDRTAVGAPKVAARKGVRTSPDSQTAAPGDPTPERPGIRISAPPVYRHHYDGARWSKRLGATPTAAYACACGRTGTASGLNSVAALIAAYDAHRDTCPLRAPQEGRAAA